MVALKYSYTVDKHKALETWSEVMQGAYIVVIHANKIPPHIGLLVDGLFYSLKAKGKDMGVELDRLGQILTKKEIATLFFKVKNGVVTKENVVQVFEQSGQQIPFGETCLAPILKVVSPNLHCATVAELLNYLAEKNELVATFGAFLPVDYEGIPYYDMDRIRHRINYLKDGKE